MARTKREHGQGGLFRHKNCRRWTIQYYTLDGRCIREATGLTDRVEAQKLLTQRLAAVGKGELVQPVKPCTVQQLWDSMLGTYKVDQRTRALRDFGTRWLHLGPVFANMAAQRVTTDTLNAYVAQRRAEEAAPATINRELGGLRRAFNLGKHSSPPKVQHMPHFPHLDERGNVRKGFIEQEQYLVLAQHARELWLRTFLEIGYTWGWREGEMLAMRCSQVNLAENTLRLEVGTTKNRDGRVVVMTPQVRVLVQECGAGKKPNDYVLTRGKPPKPIGDLRGAWRAMCIAAGLGQYTCKRCGTTATVIARCPTCKRSHRQWKYSGLIPHDLRRSAAKAARNAGVPDGVVMRMGGWRTRSMFDRYAIVSNTELEAAAQRIAEARATISGQPVVIQSERDLAAMPVKSLKPA